MKRPYLLTSKKGIAIIVKCQTLEQINRMATENSLCMSESLFQKNLASGKWTDTTDIPYVHDVVNSLVGDLDCWVLKEDALSEHVNA